MSQDHAIALQPGKPEQNSVSKKNYMNASKEFNINVLAIQTESQHSELDTKQHKDLEEGIRNA